MQNISMEWAYLFVAGVILLLAMGAAGVARALLGMAVLAALALACGPAVMEAIRNHQLPVWVVIPGAIIGVFLMVRWLVIVLFGRRASDQMVGILAADVVRAIVVGVILGPVRVMRWLWQLWR